MHWADVVAEKLLEDSNDHVISSGITPSGPIHLGSMREILTADAVARAVNDKGGNAKLIYIADNADPLRKVYPFLDSNIYEKYVGMPLAEIPAPDGNGTYDQHFLKPFFKSLESVGVFPEVVENYNSYKQGKFTECTKYFVENRDETRNILEKVSGRQLPKKWFPWTFLDSDGTLTDGEVVNLDWPNVTFLNKNKEKITNDMSKGEGKLPWRLDWPAKWKILNVTFEAFGKDHATRGGSYDTGKQLTEKILKSKTPLDLVYEWIHLKGKGVMHSSTGLAISAEDMLTMAPPEVIRWIVMKPQPNRHIDFDPGLGLLNLVDRYDQAEQDYHDGKMEENEKRAFELSQISKLATEKPNLLPYKHLVTLSQSKNSINEIIEALKRTGEANEIDKDKLIRRVDCIKEWIKNYAPESVVFEIQKRKPEIGFDDTEIKCTKLLSAKFKEIKWTPEMIHNSFYELQEESEIPAKRFFKVVYNAILGKDRGPRLGFFLATMDKNFIIERLDSY
ncbi:MAG: lysine--tRNA ligase [Candidatus Thermoplasmatota archaeon]|jgi:lysyl-tRNA synthetase class 1|nr:lysine--tRNA ligase [Candidatus Thermoplasmatota archaeon]MEC7350073.1 lysine--tRNA ligase [Candidatus Thermoplasmatota archaeon]MEC7416109.1 lysine--tRNA ligase [Candidatus Thermoplasmatota archaeon]MEC7494120.1 lysine--tRNA ligase [Candidatus Thermoplasmatota archaeon]MEC7977206.1 lysine--tRNA ligase [Candidatus Thermoplasmatota archaeon]|tara:strand:- start:734 stop:2248 length:1515 start_codon:yes stop_codon:yes gene_type:complete